MSGWWFGINNSRNSRHEGAAGHMHYRDVAPWLRGDEPLLAWPFGGAPGSDKLYSEMQVNDDVVLWMGDGVQPSWGILGFARIAAIDSTARALSLERETGPLRVLTPYPPGSPKETLVTRKLRRIFSEQYGPLRKLFARLGEPGVRPKVVTIDRVDVRQLRDLRQFHDRASKFSEEPDEVAAAFTSTVATSCAWLPSRSREIVASAAAFIQRCRPEYYFANLRGRKLWIHCGRIIPLSVRPDRVWLSVIEASLNSASQLRSWTWDDHSSYQRYVRTSSRNGYYDPTLDPEGAEWRAIAPAFFDYLDVLCAKGHQPDHRTKHTPGLREEIATWGTLNSDATSFEQAVRIAAGSPPDARRARLAEAPRKPRMVHAVVRMFQRNPDVVAEALARAQGRCELCSKPAPFVRASDGSPYLEVHHRVRLADGGDDTVENALAVCPNCHRKAHFG